MEFEEVVMSRWKPSSPELPTLPTAALVLRTFMEENETR